MLSVYNVFFPAKEHAEISVSLFLELLWNMSLISKVKLSMDTKFGKTRASPD